jgi:hypothetical protein
VYYSELLWSYTFTRNGSDELYSLLFDKIMTHPDVQLQPCKDLSFLIGYAQKVSFKNEKATEFVKTIEETIQLKIRQIQEINELMSISKNVVNHGHGDS